MPVNADDLSPTLRAQLGLKPRKKPSRRNLPGSGPYRCTGCAQEFPDYRTADKHATAEHGDTCVRLDAITTQ